MQTINQINKGGTVYDISAVYDDLDNKISEYYSTKDELTTQMNGISEQIAGLQTQLETITTSISALEGRLDVLESSVEDWKDGGTEEGELTELDA